RAGDANRARVRHFRIRIADAREVTDAGIHVQILKQAIIAILQFHFRDLTLRIANVSENDGLVWAGLRACRGKGIARNSKVIPGSARADVSGDFRFLDPLHAKGAFLHHPAHAHGDVRILRELDRIRRAFFSKRREVFLIDVEGAGDFLFADRPLVVIEKIETPNLERAIVRAITRADTTIVGHNVYGVFAVDGGVDRANGLARGVLAVLAHHRFMYHLGIFRKLALVLVVAMLTGEIAIDPQPVHRPAMGDLQFADDRDIVLRLAGDDARAAAGAGIQIDRHSPLLRRLQRRMTVDAR